ncbi:MAG: DUF378 domain-containing protein [Candidatus Pacebacteria bacterium]|nr:DUF378 domain-containing protein [Candidatus Paceibacterota bacterium]
MSELNWLDWVALILVIIGGINWGLVAFNFNLVTTIFGSMPTVEMIVYVLVGLSGIYLAIISPKLAKK